MRTIAAEPLARLVSGIMACGGCMPRSREAVRRADGLTVVPARRPS